MKYQQAQSLLAWSIIITVVASLVPQETDYRIYIWLALIPSSILLLLNLKHLLILAPYVLTLGVAFTLFKLPIKPPLVQLSASVAIWSIALIGVTQLHIRIDKLRFPIMKTLLKVASHVPEGLVKDTVRRQLFPVLFVTRGSEAVTIGPPTAPETIQRARFMWYHERLGNREIIGYLQQYTPQPGDVVINAGGYHGYFALYLSQRVGPQGQVIIFEPDPTNARIIRRNIALNHADNITLIPKGLWRESKTLAFSSRGSSSRLAPAGQAAAKIAVCSLDEELPHHNISRVDFISMDIEGAELEAIEGAEQTLRDNPQIQLAIASYHVVNGSPTHHALEPQLQALGFNTHTGFPQHLTTYASRPS